MSARLIGVIDAEQKKKDEDEWVRNDRLLGVATHARTHQHIHDIGDLRPQQLEELDAFFVEYNRLEGHKFKPLGNHGAKTAMKRLRATIAAYKKKHK